VFICLFDETIDDETLVNLLLALVQVEDNLQVAVQTPTQVYWSRNSPRGIADTVTVTKMSENPKVQRYSETLVFNYVPAPELQDHAAQPEAHQANNPSAQPPIVPMAPIAPIVLIDHAAQQEVQIQHPNDTLAQPIAPIAPIETIATFDQGVESSNTFVFEKFKKQNLYFFKNDMYNRIERKSWLDRDTKDIFREEIRKSSEKETIILRNHHYKARH
jgi:hypothetical protein